MRLQATDAERFFTHSFHSLHRCCRRAHGRHDGYSPRICLTADGDAVLVRLTAARRIDNQVDLAALHQVYYMRTALRKLVDAASIYAHAV